MGSVAVATNGSRIGKGEGYSEIEYGILRELGLVEEDVPVFTTVHSIQVVENLPQDPYDVSVDCIATPERATRTNRMRKRPKGIFWDRVSGKMIEEMPVLGELKGRWLQESS